MSPHPLHYRCVAPDAAQPPAWMAIAHGLLGSGDNWASVARELVRRRPDWGVVLPDLRMHGNSQGAPPPHTLDAAAADLAALAEKLAAAGRPVWAAAGHSLGGKVVLALRASRQIPLRQVWVLDASPGVCEGCALDPESPVVRILAALEELPPTFDQRADFVEEMVGRGFPKIVAQWLAKNLEREGGVYRFALDLGAMRALLEDYHARDLWMEAGDLLAGETVRFAVAGASQVVSSADRTRLRAIEAESGGQLGVHLLEGASHWLHMDARSALLDLMARELPRMD